MPRFIRIAAVSTALLLSAAAFTAAAGDRFAMELEAIAKQSMETKRGVTFYVDGVKISGIVKEFDVSAIIVANQEHSRIVIQPDKIAMIEFD